MLPLHLINAFVPPPSPDASAHPGGLGRGNAAAVVPLAATRWPSDEWMLAVAQQMKLSETAFVTRADPDGDGARGLRWFCPAGEVQLCGHATLATAHALGLADGDGPAELRFETRFRGTLTCRRVGDGRIAMVFPADPAEPRPVADLPAGLMDLLGLAEIEPVRAGRSRYDLLVEVAGPEQVLAASPDFPGLKQITDAHELRGLLLTAAGSPSDEASPRGDADVTSRFFAPGFRIDEDPVTGSAHCVVGPWYFDRLGRDRLTCRQASAAGGELIVTRDPDRPDRVTLAGRAVTYAVGQLVGPDF
jgi:PhzF family phenazine biosynthesis protein